MWLTLIVLACSVTYSLCVVQLISTAFYKAALNELDCGCNRRGDLDVSKVLIHAYNFETNINSSYYIDYAANAILNTSDFDSNQCIHMFVPGYHGNNKSQSPKVSRCIFSQINCNGKKPLALIVEHSRYTSPNNLLQVMNEIGVYKRAVAHAKSIGIRLGKFVAELLSKVSKKNIDIVGHSLGGQILGYLGDTVKDITGAPLNRLLAVDPAGPCYDNCPNEHIKKGQANVTIAFHCNAGELGSYQNLTDYNFYSHNGVTQRGCESNTLDAGVFAAAKSSLCSHFKCVPIAVNPAIRKDIWPAVECATVNNYFSRVCKDNPSTLAGYTVTPTGKAGTYFIDPKGDFICERPT